MQWLKIKDRFFFGLVLFKRLHPRVFQRTLLVPIALKHVAGAIVIHICFGVFLENGRSGQGGVGRWWLQFYKMDCESDCNTRNAT
jgi:hypothetical protein